MICPNFGYDYAPYLGYDYSSSALPMPPVPVQEDKWTSPAQSIGHNQNYWMPLGLLRVLTLLSLFGGIVSAWVIIGDPYFCTVYDSGEQSTAVGLVVIFNVFFSVSLLIFAMSITNFVNLPGVGYKFYLITVSLCDSYFD